MAPPIKRMPPPPPGFPALQRRYSVTKPEEPQLSNNGKGESEWNAIKFGSNIINTISGSDITSSAVAVTVATTLSSSSSSSSTSGETTNIFSIGDGVMHTMDSVTSISKTMGNEIYDKVVGNVTTHNDEEEEEGGLTLIEKIEIIENKSEELWIEMLKLIRTTALADFKKQEDVWFNSETTDKSDDINALFDSIGISTWKYLQLKCSLQLVNNEDTYTTEPSSSSSSSSAASNVNNSDSENISNQSLYTKLNMLIEQYGVTAKIRVKLWVIWSGSRDMKLKYGCEYYSQELSTSVKQVSAEEEESFVDLIDKDVGRTCMDIPLFRHGASAVLRRVLIGFARICPQVSYVQGMSSLAAFILIAFIGKGKACHFIPSDEEDMNSEKGKTDEFVTIDVETDVFWTFYALIVHRLEGYFSEGMRGLISDTLLLQSCIELTDSTASELTFSSVLNQHVGFDWLLLTPDWFLQMFSDSCQPTVSLHVWDLLFFLKDKENSTSNTASSSSSLSSSTSSSDQKNNNIPQPIPLGRITLIWLVVGIINKHKHKYLQYHHQHLSSGGLCMMKCCELFRCDLSTHVSLAEISNIIDFKHMIAIVKQSTSQRNSSNTDSTEQSQVQGRRGRSSKANMTWNKRDDTSSSGSVSRSRMSKSPSVNLSRSAARRKAGEKAAEDRVVARAAPNSNMLFKMNFM